MTLEPESARTSQDRSISGRAGGGTATATSRRAAQAASEDPRGQPGQGHGHPTGEPSCGRLWQGAERFRGRGEAVPTLVANDVELHYQVHGRQGPVLVFTHGASWDSAQWTPQVEALRDTCRVVTWDVRGHGRSTLPDGSVEARDFGRDLIELLDHLSIPSAVLCGLSMGGHISLQTAARSPERVAALVLIGTPFTNTYNWYEHIAVPINRFSTRFVSMRLFARLQARALARRNPAVREYLETATQQIPHERWRRLWGAITRMESRDLLARVRCPVLVLEGDDDWLVRRQQPDLVAGLSDVTHIIVPDAGHATNLDNPDAVNDAIQSFVAQLRP